MTLLENRFYYGSDSESREEAIDKPHDDLEGRCSEHTKVSGNTEDKDRSQPYNEEPPGAERPYLESQSETAIPDIHKGEPPTNLTDVTQFPRRSSISSQYSRSIDFDKPQDREPLRNVSNFMAGRSSYSRPTDVKYAMQPYRTGLDRLGRDYIFGGWPGKKWGIPSPNGDPPKPQLKPSGPAQFVSKLLKSWGLGEGKAVPLLGLDQSKPKDVQLVHDFLEGSDDQLLKKRNVRKRIVHLFYIRKMLWALFRDQDVERKWLTTPHTLRDEKEEELLELLSGSMDDLLLVKDYVDAIARL